MSPNAASCSTFTMERLYSSSTAKNVTTTTATGVRPSTKLREHQALLVGDALVDGAHVRLHGQRLGGYVLRFQQEHVAARQRAGAHERKPLQRDVLQVVRHEVQKALLRPERAHVHAALPPRTAPSAPRRRCGTACMSKAAPPACRAPRWAPARLCPRPRRCARAGTRLSALISSSVDATSRKSLATSKSRLLHARHLGEVLVGDLGDGDGPDVHLLAADQVQQQVERPFEAVYANLVRHAAAPMRCGTGTGGWRRCLPSSPGRCSPG